ncbi:MAG TPA: hypothetical protein VKT78_14945 [Fimbriimonadaceae bacterium]|nr:hypothetical protein [Fimbriimonadaceae bacterium]
MSRTFALLSLASCLAAAPAGVLARPLDGVHPIVMVASDLTPVPGETITYTVTLSGPASSPGTLNITASGLGNLQILPSQVSYNVGDTSVTFSGTLLLSAFGNLSVSASNGAGAVGVLMSVSDSSVVDSLVASVRF